MAFVGVEVLVGGGEAAGLDAHVGADRLHAVVEQAHQPGVDAQPDLAADVLGRRGVVRLLVLGVAVAVDSAVHLDEAGEDRGGQRQERGPFDGGEELVDLLAHGAVDAGVGHGALPVGEEVVLFGQTAEAPALEGVFLGELHAGLDLALVAGHGRFGGQDRRAVVQGELAQLRVELGVVPVGGEHTGLEVVDDHRLRDAAEVPQRVLHTTQERLRVLVPDDLAVALARVAEHRAKEMGPTAFAVGLDPRALAEVDLELLARRALHAAEGQLGGGPESPGEAFDRLVATGEPVLGGQVLEEPLRRQPRLQPGLDHAAQRLAQAAPPRRRAGGRNGGFWVGGFSRAEGRNGGF